MSYATPRVIEAAAAKTVSGVSPGIVIDSFGGDVAVLLVVSVITGTLTPTLAVAVQWSHDGGTTWATADTADTFTAITAVSNVVKRFPVKAPMLRLAYTVTGTTPSLTVASTAYTVE